MDATTRRDAVCVHVVVLPDTPHVHANTYYVTVTEGNRNPDLPVMTGPLLIGSGKFFLNLRPVRFYSAKICFGTSIVANAILILLLLNEKNKTVKPYSRVLLLNGSLDYLYTLIAFFCEMVSFRSTRAKQVF